MGRFKSILLTLFFSLFFIQNNVVAQQYIVDSLLLQLDTAKGQSRLELFSQLSYYYWNINPKVGLEYGDSALVALDEFPDDYLKLEIFSSIGISYWALGDYTKALEYLNEAFKMSEKQGDSALIASMYNNLSVVYSSKGELRKSMFFQQRALDFTNPLDTESRALYLLNIGLSHFSLSEPDKGLEDVLKSKEFYLQLDDKYGIASCLSSIGEMYLESKEHQKALGYYNGAIEIYRDEGLDFELARIWLSTADLYTDINLYDSARIYFAKVQDFLDYFSDKRLYSELHNSIGTLMEKEKKYDLALFHYSEFLKVSLEIEDYFNSAIAYSNMGHIYYLTEDYKLAIQSFSKGVFFAEKTNNLELLAEFYERISKTYDKIHDYKMAFYNYKLFKRFNDSVYTLGKSYQLNDLKFRYETEKTELENKRLTAENLMNEHKLKISSLVLFGVVVILILSTVFLVLIFLNRKKIKGVNLLLHRQKDEILEKNYMLSEQNEEIEIQSKNLKEVNLLLSEKNIEITRQNEAINKHSNELEEANVKLRELSEFKENMMGMIVHDLKNPLNIIVSNATNKRASIAGKQMMNLIRNILDVQKYREAEFVLHREVYFVKDIILNAIKQVTYLLEEKEIILVVKQPKDIKANIDIASAERVLVNYLTNAIKYSPLMGEVLINCSIENRIIKVTVSDSGPGIAKKDQEALFQRFGQIIPRNSGTMQSTGLGLVYCRLAIEAHGGEVGVISMLGSGASFWFTLELTGSDINADNIVVQEHNYQNIVYLSTESKRKLSEYADRLRNCKLYETTAILNILKEVGEIQEPEVNKWAEQIMKALANSNREYYLKLLEL